VRGKALRFAVVTAFPSEDWHSARIIQALSKHGEAIPVDPGALAASLDRRGLLVSDGERGHTSYDAFVLARGLSPRGDADAQFCIYRALEAAGALVVNRLGSLLDAQDKFRSSLLLRAAGVPTPQAAIAQSAAEAVAILRSMGEVVLKPLAGSLGEGVQRLAPGRAGEQRAAAHIALHGAAYLQAWVPNPGCDARVFVVGGKVVGAVERRAAPGEFRTNIARGASAHPIRLTVRLASVAEAAARALRLDYTGIDIITGPRGPQVIEVNGNPSFDMIFRATGKDMALDIARYVAARARRHRARMAAREAAARQGRTAHQKRPVQGRGSR
jgi:tetrahydromethanopterin:alpha-L-glutamate ligase